MNILLTSTGRRTYLINYFKDAIRPLNGKVFASNSNLTFALTQAHSYVITPAIYESNYIDFLISYCKEYEISAVISLFDIDLPILSKNKQRFEDNGINLVISESDVIDICNDKWKTYQFLESNKINTPKTYIDLDEAKNSINNQDLKFPVIVKPRWGMGSMSIYKAEDLLELEVFYNKVKREIAESYLRFESSADFYNSVLIQQFISGTEYGIEVINDLENNYIETFCKKKIAMRSGETDVAITIDNQDLKQLGMHISNKLKHTFILDADCLEQEGKFYVLELNARFGGQYPFSHLAGANIPRQLIDWLLGTGFNSDFFTIKANVKSSKDINPVIIN
ncbi:ATP-grasp domain-containing protein [Shewanella sp. JNE10-2]|uniref:ATP-grasp domain-containing protein n=1 Tax=unclassified Shewanella TaxID=196818 RepID=UPI0020047702|nr:MULTISPECIES: ATP-grasp domain-containing protein [unclassified Shewanella]MCK7645412.1 ATP-grasp domain-containing protein [Shewanella sp. JNE3-1]UPO26902.1 ATP-grasp domain-containing protein [Shewanella sp. JNE10-2]UPO34098.1 ATP-grasp domain-containing protein [Shewanella sp. JNE7]